MDTSDRIFISHAADERELAAAFVELLIAGAGLTADQIFCSSVEGHTIPAGVDFKEHMRKQLETGTAVVALISSAYLRSVYCVCELGATWVLAKKWFPLLVPPVTYRTVHSFLSNTQCLLIDDPHHLDRLKDDLGKLYSHFSSNARWNTKKGHFLKGLPEILQNRSEEPVWDEKEFRALQTELIEYRTLSEEQTEEISILREKMAALKELKDRAQVSELELSFTDEQERLDNLVNAARSALSSLSYGTREVVFQWNRGDRAIAGSQVSHDDIRSGVESGEVNEQQLNDSPFDDRTFYVPNESKPKVKRALIALDELKNFQVAATKEYRQAFEEKYNDNLDVTSRDFWKRFLR